jgi:hypothetical protein
MFRDGFPPVLKSATISTKPRFQRPPTEPDVRFSLIRLTNIVHRPACAAVAPTVPTKW